MSLCRPQVEVTWAAYVDIIFWVVQAKIQNFAVQGPDIWS